MHVHRLSCYAVDLPLPATGYTMSRGRHLTTLQSTVVKVETADGMTGFGESCTLGGNYIEAFAGDVQATVRELAPIVMDVPVLQWDVLERSMDSAISGHLAGKAVIDTAMWDLRGKILEQPVSALLGGIHQPTYPVFFPISLDNPTTMAQEAREEQGRGYRCWQLKLGEDPYDDIERLRAVLEVVGEEADFVTSDANAAWTKAEATAFMSGITGLRTFVEQPCRTMADLADLRARFRFPMLIDEVIRDLDDLCTAVAMRAADAVNIKITRVGGITRAARIRDAAQRLGLMVIIDDPMGAEISTAAVSHLAASCRPESFLAASHLSEFTSKRLILSGGAVLGGGRGRVPQRPGLGIEVDEQALGEPLLVVSAEENG